MYKMFIQMPFISKIFKKLLFLGAFLLFGFSGYGQNPTVNILGEPVTVNNTSEYIVTIDFSEDVIGFDQTDIDVVLGTVTTFLPNIDLSLYTVGVTPTGVQGNITIDIPAGAAQAVSDGSGNILAPTATTLFDDIP